jgi:protoheme IX farnesyltransferase
VHTIAVHKSVGRQTLRAADFIHLMKPELTLLSVFTAVGGAFLAAPPEPTFSQLACLVLGTFLVGASCGALNQVIEREPDSRMDRTRRRPLASGRMGPRVAAFGGILAGTIGIWLLALGCSLLAAALAVLTIVLYLFVYTPLKRKSPFATIIGGVPGALPTLIGWSTVRNDLTLPGWAFFFILFFWQMPHFLSLSWMYRGDYGRGGFRMLVVVDPSGRAASRQSLIYAVALLPAVILPTLVGSLGPAFCVGGLLLTAAFCYLAIRWFQTRSDGDARRLFFGSLAYLSLLVVLMITERQIG